jgi:hypothetical protein
MAIDQDLQEIKTLLREMPGKVATAFGVLPGGVQGPSPNTLPGASGAKAGGTPLIQKLFPNSLFKLGVPGWHLNVPSPPPPPPTPPPPSPLNMSLLKGPIAPALNMALLGPQPAPPPMNMNLLNPSPSPVAPSSGAGSSQGSQSTATATSPDLLDALKDMIRELKTMTEALQKMDSGDDTEPAEKVPTRKSMWEGGAAAEAPGHERKYPPSTPPPTVMRPSRF